MSYSNDSCYAGVSTQVSKSTRETIHNIYTYLYPCYDVLYRTSTLILDLLSAVCHIEDLNGHRKVIEAVDAFSMSKGETHRFQTLVYHFYDNSCTMEFRVSITIPF